MKIKFIILGCGSSLGVPRADGSWGKCNPNEKKNYRTRCSALIQSNSRNILIDTSPDLRHQLIKNNQKDLTIRTMQDAVTRRDTLTIALVTSLKGNFIDFNDKDIEVNVYNYEFYNIFKKYRNEIN